MCRRFAAGSCADDRDAVQELIVRLDADWVCATSLAVRSQQSRNNVSHQQRQQQQPTGSTSLYPGISHQHPWTNRPLRPGRQAARMCAHCWLDASLNVPGGIYHESFSHWFITLYNWEDTAGNSYFLVEKYGRVLSRHVFFGEGNVMFHFHNVSLT